LALFCRDKDWPTFSILWESTSYRSPHWHCKKIDNYIFFCSTAIALNGTLTCDFIILVFKMIQFHIFSKEKNKIKDSAILHISTMLASNELLLYQACLTFLNFKVEDPFYLTNQGSFYCRKSWIQACQWIVYHNNTYYSLTNRSKDNFTFLILWESFSYKEQHSHCKKIDNYIFFHPTTIASNGIVSLEFTILVFEMTQFCVFLEENKRRLYTLSLYI